MRAACPSLNRYAWDNFPICRRISDRRQAADGQVVLDSAGTAVAALRSQEGEAERDPSASTE
jgi:hypothetical protein